ncbi:hypothetical protein WMF37_08590 [Sorangium sp. So ce291]|uniref:hypothetical protein n=1 Tax=Sorangium sp. So ce291 TaxID=3133294 RepID=UPI003F64174D
MAVPELTLDSLLDKLLLLERGLGLPAPGGLLEPFPVATRDAVDIQKAARRIASFVGLDELTFVVAFAKQERNVAGHVELRHAQEEVFIEIAPDVAEFKEAVLATLAHEITHKLLYKKGVWIHDGQDATFHNEALTDAAAVYVGLGKLMLNGALCSRSEADGHGNTTLHRFAAGYLAYDQIALVHLLVCDLRDLSDRASQNLTLEARGALSRAAEQHHALLEAPSRRRKGRDLDALRKEIRERQVILNALERELLYLRAAGVDRLEAYLRQQHGDLLAMQGVLEDAESLDPPEGAGTPRHGLIEARFTAFRAELDRTKPDARAWHAAWSRAVAAVESAGPLDSPHLELFEIVTCWNDGTQLRLPRGKPNLIARCPKCRYRFAVDTTREGTAMRSGALTKLGWPGWSGLGAWMRGLFGKRR